MRVTAPVNFADKPTFRYFGDVNNEGNYDENVHSDDAWNENLKEAKLVIVWPLREGEKLTLTMEFSCPPIEKYQWTVGITPNAAHDTKTVILMLSFTLSLGICIIIDIMKITTIVAM